MPLRSYPALLPADITHRKVFSVSQIFVDVLSSMFSIQTPMLAHVYKVWYEILQLATLMIQAHWIPKHDPPHQEVAKYSPPSTNCRRTKGLGHSSEETAHSLSSQGELGETQCYIPLFPSKLSCMDPGTYQNHPLVLPTFISALLLTIQV